jgi:hypothetical protein
MTLFTEENTLACRKLATWDHSGRAALVYRVRLEAEGSIIEHLGAVKPRGDGRWSWWRWRSKFHPTWERGNHNQGVVATEELAKAKVLEGWA